MIAMSGNTFANDKLKTADARVVSEYSTISPQTEFWLAVEISPKDKWHTYWINPGDAGLATSVDFSLPEGFEIIDTIWQIPIKFEFEGMASYGYDQKHFIFYKFRSPKELIQRKYRIKAIVNWLGCKDICIPEKKEVEITLKSADKSIINKDFNKIFKKIPNKYNGALTAKISNKKLTIELPNDIATSKDLYVLPFSEGIIDNSATQKITSIPGQNFIEIKLDNFHIEIPEKFQALIINKKDAKLVSIIINK